MPNSRKLSRIDPAIPLALAKTLDRFPNRWAGNPGPLAHFSRPTRIGFCSEPAWADWSK
jgi:hypothetical protein